MKRVKDMTAGEQILPTYGCNVCTITTERACINMILQARSHLLTGFFFLILSTKSCQNYLLNKMCQAKN